MPRYKVTATYADGAVISETIDANSGQEAAQSVPETSDLTGVMVKVKGDATPNTEESHKPKFRKILSTEGPESLLGINSPKKGKRLATRGPKSNTQKTAKVELDSLIGMQNNTLANPRIIGE